MHRTSSSLLEALFTYLLAQGFPAMLAKDMKRLGALQERVDLMQSLQLTWDKHQEMANRTLPAAQDTMLQCLDDQLQLNKQVGGC